MLRLLAFAMILLAPLGVCANGGQAPCEGERFSDEASGFSVCHPRGFAARRQPATSVSPPAQALWWFMNPTMAAGALAGSEPPDLQLAVFPSERARSLEAWLDVHGLRPPVHQLRSYRHPTMPAVELCPTTMIAPGCSVYLWAGSHVYRLTAATREGETMIGTLRSPP